MCEEGECSLLGSESCSLSCRFHSSQDQSPPAALAACGDSDDSRWRAMLCSRRIFLPENRHREPDPRTAGPPWQEKGQQQPGQSLGDTTATVSPPGTALPAAQGLGGVCVPIPGSLGSWTGGTTWIPPHWSPSSSLWAHPGGLKELMPKSTKFPNIPVV